MRPEKQPHSFATIIATITAAITLLMPLLITSGCGGTGFGKAVRPDIEKQMNSARPMITACYQSALQRNRKLSGQMLIRIKTDPKTGRFHRARVARTDLPDKGLEQCVIQTIAQLSLEKPTQTSVEADYPINFSPVE